MCNRLAAFIDVDIIQYLWKYNSSRTSLQIDPIISKATLKLNQIYSSISVIVHDSKRSSQPLNKFVEL